MQNHPANEPGAHQAANGHLDGTTDIPANPRKKPHNPLVWLVGVLTLAVVLLTVRLLELEQTIAQNHAVPQPPQSVDTVPTPVPVLTSASVSDTTGTLDARQLAALNAKLAAFKASAGNLVLVVVVARTLPEDIGDYANRVRETWQAGRKGLSDGVLLVVATQDRTLAIAVSKPLQGTISHAAAKNIIENVITPHLRRGDLMGGISAGTDQVMMLLVRRTAPPVHPVAGLFVPVSADQLQRQNKCADERFKFPADDPARS